MMAHAQKLDSVFQRNGRVHLYRRGCQFSRVLAFLECGSGENDCSNTGWTVPSQNEACLATHSIRLFPLHFSSRASPCATRFRFHYTGSLPRVKRSGRGVDHPPHLAPRPSQAKVLTGGGDLREAQVDVPLSVSHSCV